MKISTGIMVVALAASAGWVDSAAWAAKNDVCAIYAQVKKNIDSKLWKRHCTDAYLEMHQDKQISGNAYLRNCRKVGADAYLRQIREREQKLEQCNANRRKACEAYAREAVRQYGTMLALGCGRAGKQALWHDDLYRHRTRCMWLGPNRYNRDERVVRNRQVLACKKNKKAN
ncbi:MAG: hypothetical protein R3E48_08795 [Burkholderiaceae bacterium]